MFKEERIYTDPHPSDGYRILVDRLWPRGVSKQKADLDLWLKDIAPSNALRQWYNHEPTKFPEFKKSYIKELESNPEVQTLYNLEKEHKTVTLLTSTRTDLNSAVILQEYLTTHDPASS